MPRSTRSAAVSSPARRRPGCWATSCPSRTSARGSSGSAPRWATPSSTGDGTSRCCSTACGSAAEPSRPTLPVTFARLTGCKSRIPAPAAATCACARGPDPRPGASTEPMSRRLLVPLALLAGLVLAPAASADVGRFIPAEAIDGPVTALGDLEVARDGTGALTYVKPVGGVDHVFVARLEGAAWQPPEQVDVGLPGIGAQPVVAAGDGGKLDIAFVSNGSLYTTVKPGTGQGYTPPQLVAGSASNPSIDLSINDVAYVSFTNPAGVGGGDVDVARKDRGTTGFAVIPAALDIDVNRPAGLAGGRSKVAVAADGVALVVWGEAGRVFARRVFERRLSTAPQDATLDAVGPVPGGPADVPDVDVQDASSFAWVVYREVFSDAAGGHARAVARRLVGSQFDPGVIGGGLGGFPAPDNVVAPRIDVNGRGDGYAASAGTGTAFGAVLKDKKFNPGVPLGPTAGGLGLPVPAVDENGDGLVAWQNADLTIHARAYPAQPASRIVQTPQADTPLSAGGTDAADGLEAAADRAGDVAIAFVQGPPGGRALVVASFDRAPGSFRLATNTAFHNVARTPLRWSPSFELWGPLTYNVEIDGRVVAQTANTALAVPNLTDGVHRWRVIAADRRGQVTATSRRVLRQDGTPPGARLAVARRGRTVRVVVGASDAGRAGRRASGVGRVTIAWGDGRRTVSRRASHAYRRGGRFTLRVTVVDKAGNPTVVRRSVTVG